MVGLIILGANKMEKFVQILPIIIMAESYLAVIPLIVQKHYGSALYWFCAGCLNLSVIFLIKKFG